MYSLTSMSTPHQTTKGKEGGHHTAFVYIYKDMYKFIYIWFLVAPPPP